MSQLPPDQPVPPTTPPPATPPPPIDYGRIPEPFDFNDFLAFRTMIAIPVIMVLFWVGVILTIIGGFVQMFTVRGGVCTGLATVILGPFIVRIYCEFLIVVFRINETLTEVLNTLRGRPPQA